MFVSISCVGSRGPVLPLPPFQKAANKSLRNCDVTLEPSPLHHFTWVGDCSESAGGWGWGGAWADAIGICQQFPFLVFVITDP